MVKNVAGYDLAKLFIGSFGTLGVIVEVALKTHPRPSRVETLVVPASTVGDGIERGRRLRDLGPGLLSVAVLCLQSEQRISGEPYGADRDGAPSGSSVSARSLGPDVPLARKVGLGVPVVIVEVGGTARATRELVEVVRMAGGRSVDEDEAARLHALIRDFPAGASARLSVPGSHTGETAPEKDVDFLAYPLLGLAYLRDTDLSGQEVLELRRRLAPFGGSVVLQSVPLDLLRATDAWGEAGPDLALMRKVKDVFDPDRVMSPGRFLDGL